MNWDVTELYCGVTKLYWGVIELNWVCYRIVLVVLPNCIGGVNLI
jgi:hypothetical protein